jgi:uncharacterized protein YndB with AHSA1/START domain
MAAESGGLRVQLHRALSSPCSAVFSACVEPAELAKWWGPRGFTAPSIEMDLRVGGAYRIAMQPPEGDLFYLSGEFREVEAPTRLVYTFRWEDPDPEDRETVVTVALGDRGPSTEFVLLQEGFATERRRALHENGWTESLDRLEQLLS